MAVTAKPMVQSVEARLRMRRSWMDGNCGARQNGQGSGLVLSSETCNWNELFCL